MTDHWSPPTAAQQHAVPPTPAAVPNVPSAVPAAPYAAPYTPPYTPPGYVQPGRPRASRTAVAALVVACVALTGVIGMSLLAVPFLFVGGAMAAGGGSGMFPESEYELLGTLPDAEPSQEYPDDLLVAEVERTLEADWSTYSDIACEPLGVLEEGATTTCTGTVDGMDEDLDLVVEDELGHFTLTYFW